VTRASYLARDTQVPPGTYPQANQPQASIVLYGRTRGVISCGLSY